MRKLGWLIVKRQRGIFLVKHQVNISTQGQKHLGAVLGSRSYLEEYVSEKVDDWVGHVVKLAEFAVTSLLCDMLNWAKNSYGRTSTEQPGHDWHFFTNGNWRYRTNLDQATTWHFFNEYFNSKRSKRTKLEENYPECSTKSANERRRYERYLWRPKTLLMTSQNELANNIIGTFPTGSCYWTNQGAALERCCITDLDRKRTIADLRRYQKLI